MSGTYSIGDAARETGVKMATIRFYEQIGLLPRAARTEGNRRVYSEADLNRLNFVRHARELGFDLDAIRALLLLQDDPNQSCAAADAIARARLLEIEGRIASLTALKGELSRMLDGCTQGRVEQCQVIEALADHSHCLHDHGRPKFAEPGVPYRRR